MKKVATVFLLFVAVVNLSSCSKSVEVKGGAVKSTSTTDVQNYENHYRSADKFINLMERGLLSKKNNQYQEALEYFQNAYANAAFGKVELTMALKEIAETYELMGDYELSANFYEAASKEAMHPINAEKYQVKASELRKKRISPDLTS
jgi:tetratricopeptide (TPR) repeat protein